MSDELFDIARLRKNWEPKHEEARPVVHRVIAKVAPAGNPLEDARAVLARLEALAHVRFPTQRRALDAFFGEARELLEAHRRAVEAPPGQAPAEDAPADPLVSLQVTLDKLEELLEVFTLGLKGVL
ncbi:hypothetical protein P2318_13390 [Myxococcaceae bacterium GXIMD 01537]